MSPVAKARALKVKKTKSPRSLSSLQGSKSQVQNPPPRLTKTFIEEYAKLNAAQKKAVDTIEGPVLVVAGPGTGKTQIVALRVANILRKTQMRPSNILCLTFSLSGAKAMRERLRSLIGVDAYGITVSTVHSFCNDLILSHPHIFEEFRALEQVSHIERLRIVQSCMKNLGVGSVLGKPSRDNERSSAVLSRISEMKREGIAVDDLRRVAPLYKAELQQTKSGRERATTSRAYQDDLRKAQQFEEFILLYEEYNEALRESHRYDYEDMILVATDALHKNDFLLASLQERYQYLLIDEFQDLNGAQNRVIETLTTYATLDSPPNTFAVGDDDQAIYRFQGASPRNMLRFLERFKDAAVITLTENYRSTQEILDAASTLIVKNEERLVGHIPGIDKQLKAASPKSKEANEAKKLKSYTLPRFLRYPSSETELAGIANILKEAHERGTPWSEMAVLCRRNEEVRMMGEILSAAKIPAILTGKQDLLHADCIREAIAILRAVEHPDHDAILSNALGCETFGCHPAELARVWIELRKRNRGKEPGDRISLRELLLNLQPTTYNLQPLETHALIEDLHAKRESTTLPSLLERLLKESHLLPENSATSADPRVVAALHAFYDYVSRRAYEVKSLTLSELLLDLDQYLREPHLTLEYDVPHLSSQGVQLMTAHAAKGLEFALVVVPHLKFRNWGNRIGGNLLALPEHLIFETSLEGERRAAQEDERRLLYVAMTRAKNRLLCTFAETYPSGEEVRDAEVSSFVADLGQTIEEKTVEAESLPAPIETLQKPPLKIDEAFRSFLFERIETYKLSATALNAFLENPQEFLWTQLLEQPQAKAPHLAFGSAVHAALETRNLALQHREPFGMQDFLKAFEHSLMEREILTDAERTHYLSVGRLILERYNKETEHDRPIIHSAERALHAHLGDPSTPLGAGIPLFGIIDRIDLLRPHGKHCRITDYKTGKPYRTAEAVRKEGRLFRQLAFYKLLCDLSPSFVHDATHFTLDFIGTEREDRSLLEFEITEAEVRELRERIQAVWSKIIALDFTPL